MFTLILPGGLQFFGMGRWGSLPNRPILPLRAVRKGRRVWEEEPGQLEKDVLLARQLQECEYRSGEPVVVAAMQPEVSAATACKSGEGVNSSSAAASKQVKFAGDMMLGVSRRPVSTCPLTDGVAMEDILQPSGPSSPPSFHSTSSDSNSKDKGASSSKKKSGAKAAAAKERVCLSQQQAAAATTLAVAAQELPFKGHQQAATSVRQSEVLVGATAAAVKGRVLPTQQQAAAASPALAAKEVACVKSHQQAAKKPEVSAATACKSGEGVNSSSAAASKQVKFAGDMMLGVSRRPVSTCPLTDGVAMEDILQPSGPSSPPSFHSTSSDSNSKDKGASSSKKREGIDRRRRIKRHLATLAKAEMKAALEAGTQPNMQPDIVRFESVSELTTGSGRIWNKKTNRKSTRESKDSCATGFSEPPQSQGIVNTQVVGDISLSMSGSSV